MTRPDDFAFGPRSELWRINRYATGLLFGPAAVLLQIAHPRVAQGVAEHSDFRTDALGRLRRTLHSVNRIAFGTHAEAEQMRVRMHAVHAQVRGIAGEGIEGPRHYSAFEPDLLLWVLATLIDASIQGYEFVWGPLPHERRERFYHDFRRFGSYFGLGEERGPQDYAAFTEYYEEMLSNDLLGSHPLCAEVAAAVVRPRHPWRDRLLGRLADFLPIETVPPAIRQRLGLSTSAWTRLRFKALRIAAPIAFRTLPKRLTYYPEARRAETAARESS